MRFHPHLLARMRERGVTESEVLATIESGERFAAPGGRTGFRKRIRSGRGATRDVTTYAEPLDDAWLVLTVVATARARKAHTA